MLDTLILILLVVLIILVGYLIYNMNKNYKEKSRIEENELSIIKELGEFRFGVKSDIDDNVSQLVKVIDDKLQKSNDLDKRTTENLNQFREALLKNLSENVDQLVEKVETKLQESNNLDKKSSENLNQFKESLIENLNENINQLVEKVEAKLKESYEIDKKSVENLGQFKENLLKSLNDRLDFSFDKSDKTFNEIIKRLTVVDEAQKNILGLSSEIESLKNIFKDKKSRGTFGEQILDQVLGRVYGDNGIYQRQHKLSNGNIADATVYINDKENLLCVDSKFPFENYNKYLETKLELDKQAFIKDVQKHIKDISKKYIILGETVDFALMFIPSESMYMDIYSEFYDSILEDAYKNNVWIVSPKSLMIYVATVMKASINYKKNKNADLILKKLSELASVFATFDDRWKKTEAEFIKIEKNFKDLDTTSKKILKKFDEINTMTGTEQD